MTASFFSYVRHYHDQVVILRQVNNVKFIPFREVSVMAPVYYRIPPYTTVCHRTVFPSLIIRVKLATKMGAIVDHDDQDAVPVCAAFFPANQNGVTTTVDTVCSIPCNLRDDRRRKHILVGDRGYISKTVADELRAFDMTLLTPWKKNMKKPPHRASERTMLRTITSDTR